MMKYRPDVDGLRALAVLPVVLFHAGLDVFSGGFVGVDIFFVISGYLITRIIAGEMQERRFSLVNFYERRVRRIFPALFAMLLFTLVMASWMFMPQHYAKYANSLLGAVFSVSNMVFWKDSGYFDGGAETKPLLHTWSLGVEEQFYIFFPLGLWIIYRFLGGRVKPWLWLAFFASLAVSEWAVTYSAKSAYFLLPSRAFEMLLGSLLAVNAFPAVHSRRVRDALGLVGLVMIIGAIHL